MKKMVLCLALLALGGCTTGFNFLPERAKWVENFNSHPIRFAATGPELVKSENVDEKNVKYNEALTAYAGYSILSNKVYQINSYREKLLKANVEGYMLSASVPDKIWKDKPYKIIGTTTFNGVEYRLIPTTLDKYVFMVMPDGQLYNEIGQIRGDRLVVLDAAFVPMPESLRMFPIKTSKTEQTKPVKGFDIKYDGIHDGKMWFVYMDYTDARGDAGSFENLGFPAKEGIVNIRGNKIRVLKADERKIEYMVLK